MRLVFTNIHFQTLNINFVGLGLPNIKASVIFTVHVALDFASEKCALATSAEHMLLIKLTKGHLRHFYVDNNARVIYHTSVYTNEKYFLLKGHFSLVLIITRVKIKPLSY